MQEEKCPQYRQTRFTPSGLTENGIEEMPSYYMSGTH